jgi:hypothetical protein
LFAEVLNPANDSDAAAPILIYRDLPNFQIRFQIAKQEFGCIVKGKNRRNQVYPGTLPRKADF